MKSAPGVRISVTKNGPYLLRGPVPLTVESIVVDSDGESESWRVESHLADRESCGLCRCGQSENKPLCDGSHAMAGFDGTETASRESFEMSAEIIEGARHDLADNKALCADARFCHRSGKLWNRIHDDSDEAAAVASEEAELCPSGRYVVIEKGSRVFVEPELAPSVAFVQDTGTAVSGPIWVRGGIEVVSADGQSYEVRNRVTLCRCGQSKNKPFCDGSHIECGFHDHM